MIVRKKPRFIFRGDQLINRKEDIPTIEDNGVKFNSNFESGNLFVAFATNILNTYDLVMQNDINTRGNTQWFYFSVSGVKKDTTLTLRIINHVFPIFI